MKEIDNNYSEFASALLAANRKGPPQETCMVLENGSARPFNQEKEAERGAAVVDIEFEPLKEVPLYGREESGWVLRFP